MSGAAEEQGAQVGLDDLRRRLYRADATEADLRRYLEEQAATSPPEAPVTMAARQHPRRRAAIIAAVTVVAIGAIAIGVLLRQPATVAAAPAATKDALAVAEDVGDGRLLAVDPGHVTGPTRTALMIEGAAAAAQRFDGVGNQVVPVGLPGAEFSNQRAVVILYTDRPSTIRWRALRLATRRDWSSYEQVVAKGGVTSPLDADLPQPFSYAGAPPSQVAVEAPAGLRWTLLVAPVNGPTDGLR